MPSFASYCSGDALRLDGDAAFALQVHRIEHLRLHFARLQAAAQLDEAVSQRRFAVIDVGNDGKVADVLHREGGLLRARGLYVLPRELPVQEGSAQAGPQLVRSQCPAEEGFDVEDRCLMCRGWPGLQCAVGNEDWPVLVKIRIAQRRFDAHVGRDTDEKQIPDVAHAQRGIERRARKAAVARLEHHQIVCLRLELIDNLEIPGAFDQQLALELRPRPHQDTGRSLCADSVTRHRRRC